MTAFDDVISTPTALAALYGPPAAGAAAKAIDHLDVHCRAFIARSPFVLVATSDASGRCDVSPKGGAPGFVAVLDGQRLLIPDAPGNRRIDSLQNVFENGHAGLLFLIPGMEETLRVNGRASLVQDAELLGAHEIGGKPAPVGLGVEVDEAFLHCAKSFKRSGLWEPEAWPGTEGLARPAQIWKDHAALPDLTVEELEGHLAEDYARNLY